MIKNSSNKQLTMSSAELPSIGRLRTRGQQDHAKNTGDIRGFFLLPYKVIVFTNKQGYQQIDLDESCSNPSSFVNFEKF